MRHQVAHRRLNRTSEHLQALLANLVTALIHHEQIRTTLPKAKEARRVAERLITMAKDSGLHRRRTVARTIRDKEALGKLFSVLGPRFLSRPGGYTRIIKIGRRLGDAAPMALLELVERTPKAPVETETKDQKEGLEKTVKAPRSSGAAKAGVDALPKAAKKMKAAKAETTTTKHKAAGQAVKPKASKKKSEE